MHYLTKMQELMPKHIKPRFTTVSEWLEFNQLESERESKKITELNRKASIERALGRSGIHKLHANCGFKNFNVETDEQARVLGIAMNYFKSFCEHQGGFVFSGNVGTGKNHLATAIARGLIQSGKTAAIVTVAELIMRFRASYDKENELKESQIMDDLIDLDLLILDEVGVQKQVNNDFEINLLSQIVDRRQLNLKPTGMITNLNFNEMVSLLGNRIMDRQTCAGIWVSFTWQSYRSRKKTLVE